MDVVMAKSQEDLTQRLSIPKDKPQVDTPHIETKQIVFNGGTGHSEVPINGLIARVHLNYFDIDGYLEIKEKNSQSKEAKRGRGRPRKVLEESTTVKANKSIIESKKQKVLNNSVNKFDSSSEKSDSENNSLLEVKKRRYTRSFHNKHRRQSLRKFNGDKKSLVAKSPRVIKPNPKLQDFVIASSVRYYSKSPSNKQSKEGISPIKPKERRSVLNHSNKVKMEEKSKNDDEVVRSFLPVFDNTQQSYDEDEEEDDLLNVKSTTTKENTKEKENKKNNSKPTPLKNKLPLANGDCSSPKAVSNIKPETATLKKVKTVPILLKRPKQVTTDIGPPQKKQKVEVAGNKKVITKNVVNTPKKPTKMNGSNTLIKPQKPNVRYILVDSDSAQDRLKVPQLEDVDFNKLVRSLKLVKLPAANWKIRIVVSKQQNITEVTFTNKEVNERCIKFSRTITGYVISFGKSVVRLLGAPPRISSFNDVSILLDIIHHIAPDDPVLEYSTNNQ